MGNDMSISALLTVVIDTFYEYISKENMITKWS